MRVISGNLRGTKLYTLEGQNTRPKLILNLFLISFFL